MTVYDSDASDRIQNFEKFGMIEEREDMLLKYALANYDHSLPYTIELETLNYCNNDCSFCPANRNDDKRTHMKMEKDLFFKIIDDLSDISFAGILSLFSNNEPLIDDRIYDFLEYARKKLPYARHAMFTNGMLLNEERFAKLVKKLDWLFIDNYSDSHEMLPNIKKIYNSKIDESNCDVRVFLRSKNQVLDTRGGISPNKKNQYEAFSVCVLPFIQMIIRPDGKISRCCQDVYGYDTLGDLSTMSVAEAWNSTEFKLLRKDMLCGKRKNKSFCVYCDIYGLHNYTPVELLALYAKAIIDKCKGKYVYFSENYSNRTIAEKVLMSLGINVFDNYNVKTKGNNSIDIVWLFDNYDELYENRNYNNVELLMARPDIWEIYINEQRKKEIIQKCRKADENNRLIFYGAGRNASIIYKKYDLHPRFIVDGDKNKTNTLFCEKIQIYTLEESPVDIENDLFLITPENISEIQKKLEDIGAIFLLGKYLI